MFAACARQWTVFSAGLSVLFFSAGNPVRSWPFRRRVSSPHLAARSRSSCSNCSRSLVPVLPRWSSVVTLCCLVCHLRELTAFSLKCFLSWCLLTHSGDAGHGLPFSCVSQTHRLLTPWHRYCACAHACECVHVSLSLAPTLP